MRRINRFGESLALALCLCVLTGTAVGQVQVQENHLVVDGQKQPQLFGAEVQYFRLRGGYGPNVPRARVLELWNKALDHFIEARMNAISFYIPWDFHEYAPGKFDFTGTVDADLDGRPDYPSRDIVTFFKLIEQRGITRIMVRPGPYINAEWGFLGFGAIPSWFHDQFPESHMRTPYGLKSRLYDYHNPDLLKYSARWFQAVYDQVLKERMGPGKPVIFVQLDNETNFQWQSIYNHDFGQRTIARYQDFLKDRYQNTITLNSVHGRRWERWAQIQPPIFQGRSLPEDQDWYRFSDFSIFSYLHKVRQLWENLNVREPEILFTLAESYNAPLSGMLPNYGYRNAAGRTGMMTVNLYPKTFEESFKPLLNSPFKADLDVKAADEASDTYLGSKQEWVLGPEIQGGWWRGIEVSPEARQQTYLTVLGHGLKAFFVYYFNEGQNWDVEWSHAQIKKLFDQLVFERRLENIPLTSLGQDFWNELQARSDRKILVGFDVRKIMKLGPLHEVDLYFDSPIKGDGNPRRHFFDLKRLGERVIAPYQDFLARALAIQDDVALVKDSESHVPSGDPNVSSVQASADWTGGLLGHLMNADMNPRILHGDLSPEVDFQNYRMLVHLDTGLSADRTLKLLRQSFLRGQTVVNVLSSATAEALGFRFDVRNQVRRDLAMMNPAMIPLKYYLDKAGRLVSSATPHAQEFEMMSSTPISSYELKGKTGCEGILFAQDKVVGYRCLSQGARFFQIGAHISEVFNSNLYAQSTTAWNARNFMKAIASEASVSPKLELSSDAVRTVAFGRKDPERKLLWITVKTGTLDEQSLKLRVNSDLLKSNLPARGYLVTDLLSKKTQKVSKEELVQSGFNLKLGPSGSTVFTIKVLTP